MTTIDPDLAAGTMPLQGPGDNEEEELQVHPSRVPDDAQPQRTWATWAAATAGQVRQHPSRTCAEAATTSSMVQDMKADDYGPEEEGRPCPPPDQGAGGHARLYIRPVMTNGPLCPSTRAGPWMRPAHAHFRGRGCIALGTAP